MELVGKCKTCLGCNLLLVEGFIGKTDCKNYVKANETGLDLCKKILEGKQTKW